MNASPRPNCVLFFNARFLTRDFGNAQASAMAVVGDRIEALGSLEIAAAAAGGSAQRVDLGGVTVVPGFHDAHLHLSAGAAEIARLDLRGLGSLRSVEEAVASLAKRLPAGSFIRGFGWDETVWNPAEIPTRESLDRAAPLHPVFLSRIDGHTAWVNSRGLSRLGIAAEEGSITGLLREQAMEAARRRLPPDGEAERLEALERALSFLAVHGVTSVQDVAEPWALPLYEALAARRPLPARVTVWLPLEIDDREAQHWRQRHPPDDPWLRVTHRKVFLDGTLGSHTAALLAPYHDRPGEHGALRVDRAWLLERVRAADAAGWAIAFHAVGDAAVACALEVIESLPARARKLPHRIEHAQVVEPSDADRMRRAGVAVSMQPAHFTADRGWIESRLGRARSQRAYPWRTLLEAGVSVAFGSDWPVASLDPLEGVRAAVLRGDPEGLSLGQAMRAYTEGSANAAGVGAQVGCLHRGLRADFVGLNHDPRELEPEGSLTDLRVVGSWIGGRRV